MISAVKVAKFTKQYTQVDKGGTEHSSAAYFTVEVGNIHLVGILTCKSYIPVNEMFYIIQNHFVRLAFLRLPALLSV